MKRDATVMLYSMGYGFVKFCFVLLLPPGRPIVPPAHACTLDPTGPPVAWARGALCQLASSTWAHAAALLPCVRVRDSDSAPAALRILQRRWPSPPSACCHEEHHPRAELPPSTARVRTDVLRVTCKAPHV